MGRFVVGDWGRTLVSKQQVQPLIFDALPRTMLLIGTSLLIGLSLGIVFGVVGTIALGVIALLMSQDTAGTTKNSVVRRR